MPYKSRILVCTRVGLQNRLHIHASVSRVPKTKRHTPTSCDAGRSGELFRSAVSGGSWNLFHCGINLLWVLFRGLQ